MSYSFDRRRVRTIKQNDAAGGPVLYAMTRDNRVQDNWSLIFAQMTAQNLGQPLIVVSMPAADYPRLSLRQAIFLLEGLRHVQKDLDKLNIPFVLLAKNPASQLTNLVEQVGASVLVTDFSPLRESRAWKDKIADRLDVTIHEVDSRNIVPAWIASDKQEYAAYTLRPKIHRLLPEFLTSFPKAARHPRPYKGRLPRPDWDKALEIITSDRSAGPVDEPVAGEAAALKTLRSFASKFLKNYADKRNDPNAEAQSGLSAYLHFGQISSQRVALEAQRFDGDIKSLENFLEELIVRRELSDNFCLYNEKYDSFEGFPDWARATLSEHRSDPREYLYSRDDLEKARTHDELWNAAQLEMVTTGKMHGYMRMYWAKKILEWTASPEDALEWALYLNNKYQLDGNDPNGYVGVAWSIGGVHDRPWFERDIFGKVRYMSYGGCRRKFDVDKYIADHKQTSLSPG